MGSSNFPACVVTLVGLAAAIASPAHAARGGPDFAGYRYQDQAEGVVFNYVDISQTGGTLITSGNEEIVPFSLVQPIVIYGVEYEELAASTNGFLADISLTGSDLSNDCPLPVAPGTGGGGFRLAVLHDDLATSVHRFHFGSAAATDLGYPGTTLGITVVQWVGTHFGGGSVDFEAILFHDTGEVLTLVASDAETGLRSSMGLYLADGSSGLNYGCDTAAFIIPGETVVSYDPGPPPSSDCCTPTTGATAGCFDASCQSAVCAGDAACCDSAWDAECALAANETCEAICTPAAINEVRVDQAGGDFQEFVELLGTPGTELHALSYVVLGDGVAGTGTVEAAIDLDGQIVPDSGLFVAAEDTFTLGVANLTTDLVFENHDTVTHLLVRSFSGQIGDDLDTDDDGVLDATPWTQLLDVVALTDPGSTELPYGPPQSCVASPTCAEVAGPVSQAFRCADGAGPWHIGNIDVNASPTTDTPGVANCVCGDGFVTPGEVCDGDGMGNGGQSATCNGDCTPAACGDGQTNHAAGEDCDDAGESATCDADCTKVTCGDGVINTTAGEACDGDGDGIGGQTPTCDIDCTAASCGDGVVNVAANEICDGNGEGTGGETARCNVDCSATQCGDEIVNNTAGETCDVGGVETETCNANCTAATCGDGVVNMAAGEMCDGDGAGRPGPTAACDPDCTTAVCGDGHVNAEAGEACDDEGESATCNDDCSVAVCGDGVVNVSAGEECDDANLDDGDGCAADCTEPPSTGSDGAGLDGTGGDTAEDPGYGSGTLDAPMMPASTDGDDTGETESTASASDDDGDGSCSCATGSRQVPWSALALATLLGIRRRRRDPRGSAQM